MEITEYLPVDFRTQMEAETLCGAEEIRLRVGQPLEILYADEKEKEIGLLTEAHMREVLNYLSGYSVYALEEELRQGYFTLEGGHRIGVSGRASYEKHGTSSCMKLLSCISGLNIRLAHEKKGCASVLIPWLYCGENVYHTFFFAPPGVGVYILFKVTPPLVYDLASTVWAFPVRAYLPIFLVKIPLMTSALSA